MERKAAVVILAGMAGLAATARADQFFTWETGTEAWEDTPWDGKNTTIGTTSNATQGAQALSLGGDNGFSWGSLRYIVNNPFDPAHHDPARLQQLLDSTKVAMDITFYPGTAQYSLVQMAMNYAGGHFISSGNAPPGPPGTAGYQIGANPYLLTAPKTITFVWDFAASMTAGGSFGTPWDGVSNYVQIHTSLNSAPRSGDPDVNGMANYSFDNMRLLRQTTSDPSWNVDANGDWSSAGNWANGVPNGVGSLAVLDAAKITSDRTITNSASVTVGSVIFDSTFNTAPHNYTIGGTGTLTFDVASGQSLLTVIHGTNVNSFNVTDDVAVSHRINIPVVANDNMTIDVSSSSTLTLAGGITLNGSNLAKSSIGTLVVSRIRGTGSLTADGGLLQVAANPSPNTAAGASVVTAVQVTPSAMLDLTNNGMIVNYDGGSPLTQIRALVASGYHGGDWVGTGINSSSAAGTTTSAHKTAIGYAEASSIGSPPTFFDQPIDGTTVLLRYVYAGDANLSGTVDLTDFTFLAANFNKPSGAVWLEGDFNYDGKVDLTDFTFLASNFNQTLAGGGGGSTGAVVPEPTSASMLALGLAVAALGRRRRKER